MLPYFIKKDYLSFTDKKWEWKYQINRDDLVIDKNPTLSELQPSGIIKEHTCEIGKT